MACKIQMRSSSQEILNTKYNHKYVFEYCMFKISMTGWELPYTCTVMPSQCMTGWELPYTCTVMHRNVWLAESSRAPVLGCITMYDWLRAPVHLLCDVSQWKSSRTPALWCITMYDWLRAPVHLHSDASQCMTSWELPCTCTVMHRNVWLAESTCAPALWHHGWDVSH